MLQTHSESMSPLCEGEQCDLQRVNILCMTYFFNSVVYDTSSKIDAIASTEFADDV